MMRGVSIKIWVSVLAVIACRAQAPPALKQVVGEVTSIDATNKQIKLKADDGTAYTVALGDNTAFLRFAPGEKDLKKATKIAFADVMVGDRALARGEGQRRSGSGCDHHDQGRSGAEAPAG